jgi:hypothetical protein
VLTNTEPRAISFLNGLASGNILFCSGCVEPS